MAGSANSNCRSSVEADRLQLVFNELSSGLQRRSCHGLDRPLPSWLTAAVGQPVGALKGCYRSREVTVMAIERLDAEPTREALASLVSDIAQTLVRVAAAVGIATHEMWFGP